MATQCKCGKWHSRAIPLCERCERKEATARAQRRQINRDLVVGSRVESIDPEDPGLLGTIRTVTVSGGLRIDWDDATTSWCNRDSLIRPHIERAARAGKAGGA
jgi:hypothetical protein